VVDDFVDLQIMLLKLIEISSMYYSKLAVITVTLIGANWLQVIDGGDDYDELNISWIFGNLWIQIKKNNTSKCGWLLY